MAIIPPPHSWQCDYRDQDKSWCGKGEYHLVENKIYNIGGSATADGFLCVMPPGDCTAGYLNEDTNEMEYVTYGRIFPENKCGYNFMSVHSTVEDREELSAIEIDSLKGEMATFVDSYTNGWEIWVRGVTETQG